MAKMKTVDSSSEAAIGGKMISGEMNSPNKENNKSKRVKKNKQAENPLVNEAYEHLKEIFIQHFHNAMVEAGQYIIDTFYDKNPIAALTKNKTKEQPPNLKALINKIRQPSEANADGDVPSIGWLYNAVNIAAHKAICADKGLQTFGILGHSHQLLLLHVPSLKSVPAEEFDDAIQSAFEEKEELAKYAHDNKLSVRKFKEYIDAKYPSDEIDLASLPPMEELRKMEKSRLVSLRDTAKRKIDDAESSLKTYRDALKSLDSVLKEIGKGLK